MYLRGDKNMSTTINNAIEELQNILEQKNQEVLELKKTINMLCRQSGQSVIYENLDMENTARSGIKPDEFAGLNISEAIEKFLQIKGTSATPEDIYESLKKGGFGFSANSDETIQSRNVSISLANPKFHKLPNGTYGLKEKYGMAVEKRKKGGKKAVSDNAKNSGSVSQEEK